MRLRLELFVTDLRVAIGFYERDRPWGLRDVWLIDPDGYCWRVMLA
jgi:hypothetical protein